MFVTSSSGAVLDESTRIIFERRSLSVAAWAHEPSNGAVPHAFVRAQCWWRPRPELDETTRAISQRCPSVGGGLGPTS